MYEDEELNEDELEEEEEPIPEEKEGRRLIFSDESVYETAEAGYYNGTLTLFMKNTVTLQEAAALAFNPAKTASITFEYGGFTDRYEGYTQPTNINTDVTGQVTITLKRGE